MDKPVTGYVVCDQDGENYGPYWGLADAQDAAAWLRDQGLACDIVAVEYDPALI